MTVVSDLDFYIGEVNKETIAWWEGVVEGSVGCPEGECKLTNTAIIGFFIISGIKMKYRQFVVKNTFFLNFTKSIFESNYCFFNIPLQTVAIADPFPAKSQ